MIVSKVNAYFYILAFGIICGILYQALWLLGGVTKGDVIEFEHGEGSSFKHVESVTIQYYVNQRQYCDTYLRSGISDKSKVVDIRYLVFAPSISRLNSPTGNWGLISGLFLVFFFSITILFLRKDIIPHRSSFLLSRRMPFVKLISEN